MEKWKDRKAGGELLTFTVIATDPNELVQPLHDRMPVIIPGRDYDRWLKADPERPPIDLLRPFDADKMTAWKVNKAVGNVKNDSPELIEPAQPRPNRRRIAPQKLQDCSSARRASTRPWHAWRGPRPLAALSSASRPPCGCARVSGRTSFGVPRSTEYKTSGRTTPTSGRLNWPLATRAALFPYTKAGSWMSENIVAFLPAR